MEVRGALVEADIGIDFLQHAEGTKRSRGAILQVG